MSNRLNAEAVLINNKMKYSCSARDNEPVITDYYPPFGDGEGYTSLELFLMSFASCSGGSVSSLLKKMRKTVNKFQVKANGERRETHPTCFSSIHLEFVLNSSDTTPEDLQKVIQLSEETYCPVWAMIKNNVEVTTSYQIIND